MRIFDCHFHVEENPEGYTLANVKAKNVIFNYVENYRNHAPKLSPDCCCSLILDLKGEFPFVLKEINEGRVKALKIHSVIQQLPQLCSSVLLRKLEEVNPEIPVIYDAFYYGPDYQYRPCLQTLIDLCVAQPERKFIVAHSGGTRLLEYFFHLRPLKNVFYDLSLSLQYLSDTSVWPDLIKLMKYTDKCRIMFGTDYYFHDPEVQLRNILEVMKNLSYTDSDIDKVLYSNASEIFKFNPA
ncbi:MAG: amidohydrolase family protein [Bacteroidetes bacterium]|nr:amidohydrolase family protein [Bacteroidota bacterium]